MRNIMLAMTALIAIGTQGCIIYEDDCDGDGPCGWGDDRDWDWDDDWCDEGDTDGECDEPGTGGDEPLPTFSLSLDPGQAELGETFLGRLSAEGEFALGDVTGLRFTGGVDVLWAETREDAILVLVDVPFDADLGPVDLVVSRDGQDAALVEGALFIGEVGTGNSSDDCE